MRPLRLIRRFHAPLAFLAIACVLSVGCTTQEEVLSLGEPLEAYRAPNGSVVYGYYVQPQTKPEYAGWHWLVIEPEASSELMQGGAAEVDVSYEGFRSNARLVPPLRKTGLKNPAPPRVDGAELAEVPFAWDAELMGPRLLGSSGSVLPVMLVSPRSEKLVTRELSSDAKRFLLVVATVALVGGLIALGGSLDISLH